MILHSCGVLQYNSSSARAGFVVLLAVDCVKGWVRPRPGLLRGMLHHSRGDLLFSLFKGLPAPCAPITAPIHKKNPRKLKWTVMEHIKVLLWLWCLLMIEPVEKAVGKTTHIQCVLCEILDNNSTNAHNFTGLILQLCVLDDKTARLFIFNLMHYFSGICVSSYSDIFCLHPVCIFCNSRGHSSLLPSEACRSESWLTHTHAKIQSYTHPALHVHTVCARACTQPPAWIQTRTDCSPLSHGKRCMRRITVT